MKRQQASSAVFLTEILLSLMIFALCASVCASLFIWSNRLSNRSGALSQAVIAAQSGAEAFKNNDSPEAVAAALDGAVTEGGCTVYYNAGWMADAMDKASYLMRIQFRQDAGLRNAIIVVSDIDGAEVYTLDVYALHTEVGS